MMGSEIVEVLLEVGVVTEMLQVDVLLFLNHSAVHAVVILCDLVSILARSWHFDGT
jgi:hypothetical protein